AETIFVTPEYGPRGCKLRRKSAMARTPKPARGTLALPRILRTCEQRFRCFDHVLRVNTTFLHYFRAWRAHAELVQPDDFSVETDIFVPNLSHPGFDRDTFTAFVRQHFFPVFL